MSKRPEKAWTVQRALAFAHARLAAAGVAAPEREARRLLSLAALDPAPALSPGERLPPLVRRRFRLLVEGRARRVPLDLLQGWTGFLDFEVKVVPGVFIPRPETEELAEQAIALARRLPPSPLALDLGTGSGVLALALARARPDIRVIAVDVSPRALACAVWNAKTLGVSGQIEFRRSDWFSAVPERFHLIVSNPPYVAREELEGLPAEVREHEPRLALDGGPGGLSALYHILREAPRHLHSGGWVLLEIGHGQGAPLVRFAKEQAGLVETTVERDLAGKERFLKARCR